MVYRDFLLMPEAHNQPSHKLRPKWYGPFTICKKVGPNAYGLNLPSTLRCHPVFNISAFRPHEDNVIPGRRQPTPPQIRDLNGYTRHMVESVLDHRRRHNQLQYSVRRKGYADATWEPENLQDESGTDTIPLKQCMTSCK